MPYYNIIYTFALNDVSECIPFRIVILKFIFGIQRFKDLNIFSPSNIGLTATVYADLGLGWAFFSPPHSLPPLSQPSSKHYKDLLHVPFFSRSFITKH